MVCMVGHGQTRSGTDGHCPARSGSQARSEKIGFHLGHGGVLPGLGWEKELSPVCLEKGYGPKQNGMAAPAPTGTVGQGEEGR